MIPKKFFENNLERNLKHMQKLEEEQIKFEALIGFNIENFIKLVMSGMIKIESYDKNIPIADIINVLSKMNVDETILWFQSNIKPFKMEYKKLTFCRNCGNYISQRTLKKYEGYCKICYKNIKNNKY
jgi:hypothetical protein